jgi:predicted MFS family arabinose efflux permease
MFFGTFIGALADRIGRKRACVWYCITYILSCVTKHFKDYNTLMLGRVLGGTRHEKEKAGARAAEKERRAH